MTTSKLLRSAATILLLSALCTTARADDSYDPYALQKAILPPNSVPLRKSAQDISECKKDLQAAASKQAKK